MAMSDTCPPVEIVDADNIVDTAVGQSTTTATGPVVFPPSFPDATVAELSTVPHVAVDVGEEIVTVGSDTDVGASEANMHDNTDPDVLTEHAVSPPLVPPLTDHDVPGFDGNTSDTVTPDAVPGPPFDTVNVYEIASPAFTTGVDVDLSICTDGASTTKVSDVHPLNDPSVFADGSPLYAACQ